MSELTTLDDARRNVRAREDSELADIYYILGDGRAAEAVPRDVVQRMSEWLARHEEVEAVVWTGLPSNWMSKRGREFSPRDAVQFLAELENAKDHVTYSRAREYIVNAPSQIDTTVRRALSSRGWENARLPGVLFED
jgi:hypothetical protein